MEPERERCPICGMRECDHFDEDGNLREEYFAALVDDDFEEGFQERF